MQHYLIPIKTLSIFICKKFLVHHRGVILEEMIREVFENGYIGKVIPISTK